MALRAYATAVAGVLAACGGGGAASSPDSSQTFLAFSSSFTPFRSWTSFHSDGPVDDGTFPPDVLGPRTQYINTPPPHGAAEFPVGTVIVEARESGTQKISPSTASAQWYLPSAFQTEVEIGLAERLELGLYQTFVPDAGEQLASKALFPGAGNGLKQRLRYIFADPHAWPIDVGVYGELVENEREIELEAKLLLQKRFGRLRIAANVSAEYELYFSEQREVVLNPALGATYEVTPSFHLGLDSWLRGEYPRNPPTATRSFGLGPEAYLGPAMMCERRHRDSTVRSNRTNESATRGLSAGELVSSRTSQREVVAQTNETGAKWRAAALPARRSA